MDFSYLAHGTSIKTTSWSFHIGQSTMYKIVHEVCIDIAKALESTYLKFPNAEEFLEISKQFQKKTHFANVIACADGKHVRIRSPPHSGTYFYNYKKFFSIVLMALVDAHCRFIWVNIGDFGKTISLNVL